MAQTAAAGAVNNITVCIDKVIAYVWGWPLLGTLLATGVIYMFALKFLPVRYLVHGFRHMFVKEKGAKGEVSNFASLCTALATTIGTGNIVGVATAIAAGGPGALFWMEVAAFFGLATKYAEGFLAIRYRRHGANGRVLGGPFQYIEMGLGRRWKILAVVFSTFTIAASVLGVGTFTQVNCITDAVVYVFDPAFNPADSTTGINLFGSTYSPWAMIVGAGVTLAVAAVVVGGIKRIATVASVLVPFMAVFYVAVCLTLIACHPGELSGAVKQIFKGAFNPAAVGGGALGTFFVALQSGVSRGIFSNEAGMGSSPIASSVAQTNNPVSQGLVSMTGVFLDTAVVCTLTGLVIVMMGSWRAELNLEGVNITLAAFSRGLGFGRFTAELLLTLAMTFFAFTTIIGWTFYAERSLEYLTGIDHKKPIYVFRIAFIVAVALGPYLTVKAVWGLAVIFCGLMAFPNLIALLALAPQVVKETREYFESK